MGRPKKHLQAFSPYFDAKHCSLEAFVKRIAEVKRQYLKDGKDIMTKRTYITMCGLNNNWRRSLAQPSFKDGEKKLQAIEYGWIPIAEKLLEGAMDENPSKAQSCRFFANLYDGGWYAHLDKDAEDVQEQRRPINVNIIKSDK